MKIIYILLFFFLTISTTVISQNKTELPIEKTKISYLEKNTPAWKYLITFGAWMNAMRGDISANELYGYIDNQFYNKYNGADFSFYGYFQARKERVSYTAQFTSSNQSDKYNYDNDSLYSRSITSSRTMFITTDVSYEFYRNKEVTFDLYGGARFNFITNLIENFYNVGGSVQEGQTKFFIDPVIGTKFFYIPFKGPNISRLFINGNFDVGGYGLVSFLSFESYFGTGYKVSKAVTLNLGYRYIDVHYGTDTYLIDAGIQGIEFTATTNF
ncbi:MAG: hypothetical protein WAT71_04430 [Ignavibacteria bacterium]